MSRWSKVERAVLGACGIISMTLVILLVLLLESRWDVPLAVVTGLVLVAGFYLLLHDWIHKD